MSDQNTIVETPVEEIKPEEVVLDEVEQAAVLLHQASKRFRGMAYKLNARKKRAASRVLEAVLFEPLEEVKLEGKEEQELFKLCQQIMFNKAKVMNYAIENRQLTGDKDESKEK